MQFSNPSEPFVLVGKGEENIVLLHQEKNFIVRIALEKTQGQKIRQPCKELQNDLKSLTPKIIGVCEISGEELIQRIFQIASVSCEGKLPTSLFGLVMECAFLPNCCWRFEIKPKWGFRAITKSVRIVTSGFDNNIIISFQLPEIYWTESKYFLKQKFKKRASDSQNLLKYNPEIFFSSNQDASIIAQCLKDCFEDQVTDSTRNNFSMTLLSHSGNAENVFQRGGKFLVESKVLKILSEHQQFGQISENNDDDEDGFSKILLEAPMMDFLMKNYEKIKMISEKDEEAQLEFEQVSGDEKIQIRLSKWIKEKLHERMIERLYNATCARDVSIMVSFSEEESGREKVSVIDLDDKSEYRSVEEIAKRAGKVYGVS
jgi:hypothetical protein